MAGTRNAYCSFCRKEFREAGPLVEGPDDVYICTDCINLCLSIVIEEKCRHSSGDLSPYSRLLAERIVEMTENVRFARDPNVNRLLENNEKPDPALFARLTDLSAAAALLEVMGEVLLKVKAKGLSISDLQALEKIEAQIAQVRESFTNRIAKASSD